MSSYFRVRVYKVPSQLEEDLITQSMDCGATGASEVLQYIQPDLTYDPSIVPIRFHDLDIYFAKKPESDFFSLLKNLVPGARYEEFEEENKDWLAEWKKGFEPFNLVGDFWVVPSWSKSPVEPNKSLLIDPGMAFGTGTHATTKMASAFLNRIAQNISSPENMSLLDVGTGTAILAMLAAKLGFGIITGLEIDPEARRVARENVALNDLKKIEIQDQLIEEVHDQYDVVIANIIDGVLVQIKDDLLRVLAPGGHLFLTGILLEREDIFLKNFIESSGCRVVRRLEKDEWVGYWLQS